MCFDRSCDLLPPVDHQERMWYALHLSAEKPVERKWVECGSFLRRWQCLLFCFMWHELCLLQQKMQKMEVKLWNGNATGGSKTAVVRFMLQTAMVWSSSQPRWSLPVRLGFTSWAIFRLRQSMAIISSLPFSGLEQLRPLQQWWKKKQRLVYDGLILKWLSVSSQALITGDSCTFIFLPPLHRQTDLLSH